MTRPKGIPSNRKGRTYEEMYGKEKADKMKKKLSEHNKKYNIKPPIRIGIKCSEEQKRKTKKSWTKKKRKIQAMKMSKLVGKKSSLYKHHNKILKEVKELQNQGFRTIPITKVIPDIIAIKDNKVFAIEVEYGIPNYDKYNQIPGIYDDVIWIIKNKRKGGIKC